MKAYCLANKQRKRTLTRPGQGLRLRIACLGFLCFILSGRRDKYQRKIWEYWVDVETVGSLAHLQAEEFNQHFEIIDCDMELPGPTLGSSPDPHLGAGDDEEEESSHPGDDDDDDEPPPSTSKKNKSKRRASTPTPKSKSVRNRSVLTRSRRKDKPSRKDSQELEEALQAGYFSDA